jgi:hypothetical protein
LVAFIALTNLTKTKAHTWLDELLGDAGLVNARVGAAASAVHILWRNASLRDAVSTLIVRLLDKSEEPIWHLVFSLFNGLETVNADAATIHLMTEIAARIHRAPPPKDSYVVECLAGLVPRHAITVAVIASQLIQLWRNQLSDMQTSVVLASREIIDLAITLHRLPETREKGIQMFEQLVEIGAYESRQVLDEIDNRFRTGRGAVKPRLSRSARRKTAMNR